MGDIRRAAVVLVLAVTPLLASCSSFDEDADTMCAQLGQEYRVETAVNVISSVTPGEDARTQLERAEEMARTKCPATLPLIFRAERLVLGG